MQRNVNGLDSSGMTKHTLKKLLLNTDIHYYFNHCLDSYKITDSIKSMTKKVDIQFSKILIRFRHIRRNN